MNFEAWIGRETRAKDRLDEGLAHRWLATFDLAKPHPPIMPQGMAWAGASADAASAAGSAAPACLRPQPAPAIAPATQAVVSVSPPNETALRTASSKSVDSRKATAAAGTVPVEPATNTRPGVTSGIKAVPDVPTWVDQARLAPSKAAGGGRGAGEHPGGDPELHCQWRRRHRRTVDRGAKLGRGAGRRPGRQIVPSPRPRAGCRPSPGAPSPPSSSSCFTATCSTPRRR